MSTVTKNLVLNYLKGKAGKDVPRKRLLEKSGLSNSRLSEVLASIKDDGYNIIIPPRSGKVRLEIDSDQLVLPDIDNRDIRQWLIVFILSLHRQLTFNDILVDMMILCDNSFNQLKFLANKDIRDRPYDNANIIKSLRAYAIQMMDYIDDIDVANEFVSVTSLRKDLNNLCEEGIVCKKHAKHTTYQLTGRVPRIIPISSENLYDFFHKYEEVVSSANDIEQIQSIINKIQLLSGLTKDKSYQSQFGLSETIDQEQLNALNEFITHHYQDNIIEFDYYEDGDFTHLEFGAGLLFYCKETSKFFILGKDINNKRILSLRLDKIKNIKDNSKRRNKEFHAEKYYNIYGEMFSSTYEEKCHNVRVLVQDYANVAKRFSDLASARKKTSATLYLIEDPPDGCEYKYIYEDKVRGLSDFAKYIASFGYSAIAIEPPELREILINKFTKITERYEEEDE